MIGPYDTQSRFDWLNQVAASAPIARKAGSLCHGKSFAGFDFCPNFFSLPPVGSLACGCMSFSMKYDNTQRLKYRRGLMTLKG